MKDFNKFEVREMSSNEARDVSGGFLGAIAIAIASVSLGYNIGKDLYHIVND